MLKFLFIVFLFFSQGAWADGGFQEYSNSLRHNDSTIKPTPSEIVHKAPLEKRGARSLFSSPISFENPENTYFLTNFQNTYRMGIGLDMMGKTGLAGVSLQLVLNPKWSLLGGFGLAGGFSSAFVEVRQVVRQYKKVLAYWGVGLAQWASESGQVGKTLNPGFLRGKFLKPGEISTGSFRHYLISGSLGFKYLQTSGDLKGSGFYMELSPLFDLSSQALAPSAGFGVVYYF